MKWTKIYHSAPYKMKRLKISHWLSGYG